MPIAVRGPAWAEVGMTASAGRYPLRVEGHVRRLVDRMLPGVISTTPHGRSYALHSLVWAEADRRGLELAEANELMRRCEVVFSGISLLHRHEVALSRPHGADQIEGTLADGVLDVAGLSQHRRYSQSVSGFGGIYAGSETVLGLLAAGRPPKPGERLNEQVLRETLGPILDLASHDTIETAQLIAHPELCMCGARHSADGAWLRQAFLDPPRSQVLAKADDARRETAQLLAAVIDSGAVGSLQSCFRVRVGFGDFLKTDPVAAGLPVARAWRGVVLRNYSVGAWRRLWSWLVDQLAEPRTPYALGRLLAAELPDVTVGAFVSDLSERLEADRLAPLEEELRAAKFGPHPQTELSMLALGALRVDDLDADTAIAFAGSRRDDDLGPIWFRRQLEAARGDRLPGFAASLAERLVDRAQRVALSKMELRKDGSVWLPSRIRERDGLVYQLNPEGWADVGLRIDTFGSVLLEIGALDRDGDSWQVSEAGRELLG